MERETRTFKTSQSQIEVELKTYINAGEKRKINDIIYKEMSASPNDEGQMQVKDLSLSSMKDYQDEMVRQIVVAVNGKKENIFDVIMELRIQDADEIYEVVGEIFKEEDFLEKRSS